MERSQGGGTTVITKNLINESKQEEEKVIRLKLKADKHVHWTEDTIDNEHMNKRKSKICCIFEKQKTHPDDTDSCSSCSSDSENGGNNYDRFPKHQRDAMRKKKEQAEHQHKKACGHKH